MPLDHFLKIAFFILAGLFFAFPAATTAAEDDQKVLVNLECPMPGYEGEPVRADKFVDIEGRRVYVCCGKCKAKLSQNPGEYTSQIERVYASSSDWVTQAQIDANNLPMFDPFAATSDSGSPDAPDETTETSASADQSHDHDLADHAAAGSSSSFVSRLVAWLGKLHPASVNFPVAMLVAAAFAELMLMVRYKPFFEASGRYCLWIGSLGAALAALLGWFWGGFHLIDSSNILTAHRWLGTLTALVAIGALIAGEASHHKKSQTARGAYRVMIALAALLVVANALLGGAVEYGLGYYLEF